MIKIKQMDYNKSNREKPRIIFLSGAIEGGGAERVVVEQASGVDPDKFDKVLMVTRKCDSSLIADADQIGLKVIVLDREKRWDIKALIRLRREFQQADLIHAHQEGSILQAALMGINLRAKLVAQFHNKISEIKPIYRRLVQWACKQADGLIFVSQLDYEEHMASWHPDPSRMSVVYNGIDSRSFGKIGRGVARERLGLEAQTKIIGVVGRISRRKGYEFFLESAVIMKQEWGQDIRFLIVGGGSEEAYRQELEARIKNLGIFPQVIFLGYRRDVISILPALDVFVLPSVIESLPIALLEAMASGIPVVATKVGGIPEVIVNGESGLLVPAGDPQAIATAVLGILRSPDKGQKMAQAARARVNRKFSLEAMIRGIETIYEKLLFN